jgi:glycosyltransferase involved in cell wall biosynthesis
MGSSPIRVILDGTAATRSPGGARARFLHLYAEAALRPGLEITAVVRRGSGLEGPLAAAGVAVIAAGGVPPPFVRLGARGHPAMRHSRRARADLFGAETLPLPRTRGLPAVLTLHDMRFLHAAFSSPARRIYAARFLRRNLRRAAAVIAVSHATADELRDSGLYDPERIHVVPNAAAELAEIDAGAAAATLKRLGVEKPYVLCLGRAEPRKNVARLLDAWESGVAGKRNDPTLVVAGDFSGRGGRALRGRVQRSGALRERVAFTGSVSEEEKAALLASADAFVQPSLYEGFGMTLLEAMAAGAPVACSSLPAHWEAAGTAALYFDPRDPADMAAVLVRIARNRQLRADLTAAATRQAARYTWKRSASMLEEVYRSFE